MPPRLCVPVLAGPKVVLRPWQSDDAEALQPACGDPDICRFTTVPRGYTREAPEAWIDRQHQRLIGGAALVMAIVPSGYERPLGMIGLFGLDGHEETARRSG